MSGRLVIEYKAVVGGRTSGDARRNICDAYGDIIADHDEGDTLGISIDDVRELLEQNRKLKENVATLRNVPKGTLFQDSSVQNALAVAETAISGNDVHFNSLWDQIPVQQKPIMHNNNAAQAVFSVPELLELILHELTPKDILRAQGVSHTWKDGVEGSTTLHQVVCLKPAVHYYSPFELYYNEWPGIKYRRNHNHNDAWRPYVSGDASQLRPVDNDLHIEIQIDLTAKISTIGQTCQAMFLCQPPPKEATIIADNISLEGEEDEFATTLSLEDDDGLTIGALIAGVGQLLGFTMEELDRAASEYGTKYGTEQVYLQAVVQLSDSDPIIKQRHVLAEEAAERLRKKAARQAGRAAAGEDDYDSEDLGSMYSY